MNFRLFKKPSVNVVAQIHSDFYSEVDNLIKYALASESEETTMDVVLDKASKLASLGFTSSKEVAESNIEKERIRQIAKENRYKGDLREAINYFSQKYPHYKFITEESVLKICKKYGLVYGNVDRYKGEVPDKNLREMLQFRIDDSDYCWEERIDSTWDTKRNYGTEAEVSNMKEHYYSRSYVSPNEIRSYFKTPMKIAANAKDFDMANMEVKEYKIQDIPDPVVLVPVVFKNRKHYLISTAWGAESSDADVVNQRMN